jgi:hypothetical protein
MRSGKAAELRIGDGRDDAVTCLAPGQRWRRNETRRYGGNQQSFHGIKHS